MPRPNTLQVVLPSALVAAVDERVAKEQETHTGSLATRPSRSSVIRRAVEEHFAQPSAK